MNDKTFMIFDDKKKRFEIIYFEKILLSSVTYLARVGTDPGNPYDTRQRK